MNHSELELLKMAVKIKELINEINLHKVCIYDTLDASIKRGNVNNESYYNQLNIYDMCIVRLEERYIKVINNLIR